MKQRYVLYLAVGIFMIGFVAITSASDLAIYSGPTNSGWISQDAAIANAETVMNAGEIQNIFDSIINYGDGDEVGYDSPLGTWLKDHTGNGQQDVLFLSSGTTPSALYQFPNADPDGSNIELFLEDGNVLINVADWIGYMSYEGGVRSADNGANGAANIFDVPGLSFGDQGGVMEPTPEGLAAIPSLKAFDSARPWHLGQFADTDWDVTIFATDGADSADPAVAVNSVYGGIIAAMWQDDAPEWPDDPDPRGIGVVEFITNWLAVEGNLTPVEPHGKAATTWGGIKSHL